MSTVLELQTNEKPWTFKSLGVHTINNNKYTRKDVSTESTETPELPLFPIDSIVTIKNGNFPFHHDTKFSRENYIIGNIDDDKNDKKVNVVGSNISCRTNFINKYGKCTINVVEYNKTTNKSTYYGGSRSKSNKSRKNKRSKRSNRKYIKKSKKRNSKH